MLAHRQRRWPNIETTQGQWLVGVLMATIAVLLYSQMRGDRPHFVYTPTPPLPPPPKHAIVVICSAKAVSAHL